MYTFRQFKVEEIPDIVKLIEHMYNENKYTAAFDAEHVTSLLVTASLNDMMTCLVCVHETGQIVGALAAIVSQPIAVRELYAYEQTFILLPKHRNFHTAQGLLRAYKEWAVSLGAVVLNIFVDHHDKSDERVARMLEHHGYKRHGIALRMELNNAN